MMMIGEGRGGERDVDGRGEGWKGREGKRRGREGEGKGRGGEGREGGLCSSNISFKKALMHIKDFLIS